MSDSAAQSIALSLGVSALITVGCRRMRIPALLPLLVVGVAMGTSGVKLVDGSSLGTALTGFITVAIGLLIFEGALHLNKEELGRAPRAVWGLLTVGAVVTWGCSAAVAHYLLGMSVPISVLLGAALIVTGPTVVQPILRLVRVTPRLQTVLSAEAVLIDPVGVVATITTLEVLRLYVLRGPAIGLAREGLWIFTKPLLGGAGVGVLMGMVGYWLLRAMGKSERPEPQLLNLVAIGVCMTCVGLGEAMTPEGGLAAVTICGVLMARAKVLGATELRAFKELLAVILVGTLFVLLSSRFEIGRLQSLSWREGVFVLLLLFVIRPIAVFLSTWRTKLDVRERLFAATFAPRGIVALSVATVASAELAILLTGAEDVAPSERLLGLREDAERLELIMFVVIAGTVLLGSTLSPVLAWALKVKAGKGNGVLLIGAHPLGVAMAKLLTERGVETRIIDTNTTRVEQAKAAGLDAVAGDATDARWMDDVGVPHGTGWMIAWTGNHDVDQLLVRWAEERLGQGHAGVWSSKPVKGQFEPADMGGGQAVVDLIDRLQDGRSLLVDSADPGKMHQQLGWIREGRFTLKLPATKMPEPDEKTVFIGVDRDGKAPWYNPTDREKAEKEKLAAENEPPLGPLATDTGADT